MAFGVSTANTESHFYTIPAASPLFALPPYRYKANRQATIMFKTTPEAIAKLIPAPLQTNPQDLLAVYYSTLTMYEPYEFTYREVGVFAPVATLPQPPFQAYFDLNKRDCRCKQPSSLKVRMFFLEQS